MLRSFRFARLKFTKTHEWLNVSAPGTARLGISKFAQDQLGEVVYCELPTPGTKFERKSVLCTLESVKAVGEVYCPIPGSVVTAVNEALKTSPADLNADPEGKGWLVELKFDAKNFSETDFLDSAAYSKLCSEKH